jgi:hypothetical protein
MYLKRRAMSKDPGKKYELLDSYYDFIPRYNDIFLEATFLFDVIKRNIQINSSDELVDYLLQGKKKVEEKLKHIEEENQRITSTTESTYLKSSITLERIKLEIQELKALAPLRRRRQQVGLSVSPKTLHFIITGDSAACRAYVARKLTKIYLEAGLLVQDKVVEIGANELVGDEVGGAKYAVSSIFEKSIGGTLFIDDAFLLFSPENDKSNEAIKALLGLINDYADKNMVIFAMDAKQADEVFISSPWLTYVFSKSVDTTGYDEADLTRIFM